MKKRPAGSRAEARSSPFSSIEDALVAIRSGEIVIVVDDPSRENEGDFVMAAERVSPDAVNFMITHGRGLLCLPMSGERLDALRLPAMVPERAHDHGTAFSVSIDLAAAGATGVSAQERSACISHAASPGSRHEEFRTPGHVFPLRAKPGGVLERPGHTEAAVDLARLAGLEPAGVICEIMNDDGTMARLADLVEVARAHDLHLVTIADLVAYRMRRERLVRALAEAPIPTPYGSFRMICFESLIDGVQHVALVHGDPGRGALVRVHVECLTGDVFGSERCGCGARLREAMRVVAAEGRGVVVYLRRHEEGRVAAPNGLRSCTSYESCGPSTRRGGRDDRLYANAAQILSVLGIDGVRLLVDGRRDAAPLELFGVHVRARVPLGGPGGDVEHLRRGHENAEGGLRLERFELA